MAPLILTPEPDGGAWSNLGTGNLHQRKTPCFSLNKWVSLLHSEPVFNVKCTKKKTDISCS